MTELSLKDEKAHGHLPGQRCQHQPAVSYQGR
jgi:hypothetical protein